MVAQNIREVIISGTAGRPASKPPVNPSVLPGPAFTAARTAAAPVGGIIEARRHVPEGSGVVDLDRDLKMVRQGANSRKRSAVLSLISFQQDARNISMPRERSEHPTYRKNPWSHGSTCGTMSRPVSSWIPSCWVRAGSTPLTRSRSSSRNVGVRNCIL